MRRRIFSLIHVRLNYIAILAFTSFFSSFSKYQILLLILQGKLKIISPKFIELFIIGRCGELNYASSAIK